MAKYSGSADNGEFDRALQYALLQLGTPSIAPKPEQRKAIHSIYRGRDVFVWLPTGFGKSLCYEVLPFVMDHKLSRIDAKSSLVLVVSPLIVGKAMSRRVLILRPQLRTVPLFPNRNTELLAVVADRHKRHTQEPAYILHVLFTS